MCNTGECPYEDEDTGKCTLPGSFFYKQDDSACMQRIADFNFTKEYLNERKS